MASNGQERSVHTPRARTGTGGHEGSRPLVPGRLKWLRRQRKAQSAIIARLDVRITQLRKTLEATPRGGLMSDDGQPTETPGDGAEREPLGWSGEPNISA